MKLRIVYVLLIGGLLHSLPAAGQEGASKIRLNQVGFYPGAPKEAIVVGADLGTFDVIEIASGEVVFSGELGPAAFWDLSEETVRSADFSSLSKAGEYAILAPGIGRSYAFKIALNVHRDVARAALKGYYFQRVSTPLEARFAGAWARPTGHPDRNVFIHASAASAGRPEGSVISAPYGWYDAGDYNKYIVNSGISTYTLLALYEHYPEYAETLNTNIPESNNDVPDLLDEALWNLRWMLAMQDPVDGGVYHKLTHANFQGIVMPHEPTDPRYVVQKGTGAALDFAAVMAQAARVYSDFPDAYPGLADSMRTAALSAWGWARRNPDQRYRQNALNQTYDPDIVTGAYGNFNVEDEFDWAAAELFITTQADSFLSVATPLDQEPNIPSWGNVRTLGWYTLLHHRQLLPSVADTNEVINRYLSFARELARAREQAPYRVVMGSEPNHFIWGSNSVAANQGMALLQAFQLSADSTFLWAALSNQDYLLGRNATGYSFVTGLGSRPATHPHHRPSEADSVADPVPGLLVGGPNPGQQDGCTYESSLPARSYLDDWCSYASNEIAINWNAPLVYLAAGIEAGLDK